MMITCGRQLQTFSKDAPSSRQRHKLPNIIIWMRPKVERLHIRAVLFKQNSVQRFPSIHPRGWKWMKVNESEWNWMKLDEIGWNLMKVDESGWKWMTVDERLIYGWQWIKMDERGWKWMKVDESGWKWMKVDETAADVRTANVRKIGLQSPIAWSCILWYPDAN